MVWVKEIVLWKKWFGFINLFKEVGLFGIVWFDLLTRRRKLEDFVLLTKLTVRILQNKYSADHSLSTSQLSIASFLKTPMSWSSKLVPKFSKHCKWLVFIQPNADELPHIYPSEALNFLTWCFKVKAIISLISRLKKNLYVYVNTGEKWVDDHMCTFPPP